MGGRPLPPLEPPPWLLGWVVVPPAVVCTVHTERQQCALTTAGPTGAAVRFVARDGDGRTPDAQKFDPSSSPKWLNSEFAVKLNTAQSPVCVILSA